MQYPKMQNPGFIPDPQDDRDFMYDHIAFGARQFGWRLGYDIERDRGIKLPVKDQGVSSSCVYQAIATGAYILNLIEMQGKGFIGREDQLPEFSAKSGYSQISLGPGIGAYTRDGLKLLKNYGVNRESRVPSADKGNPPSEAFMLDKSWMGDTTDHNARNFRSKQYRFLEKRDDMDLIARAIRDSHFVILGFYGQNGKGWGEKFPQPPEYVQWSHLVVAVGAMLIEGKRYIKIINSWGTGVGENGFQWIGEEYFESGNVHYGAVIIDKPNGWFVHLIDKYGKRRPVTTNVLLRIQKLLNSGFIYGNK